MTVVLSIAQSRALVNLLPTLDDRQITLYEDKGVLVVDPKEVRGDVDDRKFFITKSGVLSEEYVEPIATPDMVVTTPEEPKKSIKEKILGKKDESPPADATPAEEPKLEAEPPAKE